MKPCHKCNPWPCDCPPSPAEQIATLMRERDEARSERDAARVGLASRNRVLARLVRLADEEADWLTVRDAVERVVLERDALTTRLERRTAQRDTLQGEVARLSRALDSAVSSERGHRERVSQLETDAEARNREAEKIVAALFEARRERDRALQMAGEVARLSALNDERLAMLRRAERTEGDLQGEVAALRTGIDRLIRYYDHPSVNVVGRFVADRLRSLLSGSTPTGSGDGEPNTVGPTQEGT